MTTPWYGKIKNIIDLGFQVLDLIEVMFIIIIEFCNSTKLSLEKFTLGLCMCFVNYFNLFTMKGAL